MSFYGNISNAGKTQMSFDRVYPNRKIMEENAPTDGVFIGRFVLIEYDDTDSPVMFIEVKVGDKKDLLGAITIDSLLKFGELTQR